ncbi:GNAT family N-acetyltransferase [Microbacterium sp. C7(2022)]|uniref:GNAT family N-acetyltransferase n=1 Tax=Microbacterium sp. C7(2022) TaxID=2992759 RepID=UPI00237A5778|nr:GNAT family N-acetyltransferase [Microbacterium sp. C7(2022)]MDE0547375.1 GNAT family N-acetyltransferase [Microbacterium sp. C7(2022)]
MQPVDLQTTRLTLRAPGPDDIEAIFEACQDPEIPRWTTVPSPYARSDAEEFVAKTATWWHDDAQYVWTIRLGSSFAGVIGLHEVTPRGSAEIGFWLSPDARGQRVLTEAGRAVIDFAFSPEIGMRRLSWRAVVGNVPSAKTARALGFRYEGTLRQALTSPRGRDDGWVAGLLAEDDRMPHPWPVLEG